MAPAVMEVSGVEKVMRPLDEIRAKALELNLEYGNMLIHRVIDGDPVLDDIDDGVTIIHDIEDEPEVTRYNYFLGYKAQINGERVVVVKWRKSPEEKSP